MRFIFAVVFVTGTLAAAPAAQAGESSVWWDLENKADTLRRDALRPEYLAHTLDDCARLGDLHAKEPEVAAKRVAAAREACVLAVTSYVRRCLDASGDRWCKPVRGDLLATSIGALGALSKDEQAVFDRIPDQFWIGLAARHGEPPAQDINRDVDSCIDAGARVATRAPAQRFREAARDLCARAATAFARDCLSARGRRCLAQWDKWEQARDAARGLATLTPEQAAAFDRILGSPELADHRVQVTFDAIFQTSDRKQVDRCATITKLHELLGAPTPELRKRVQDASGAPQRTNELSRYGTYLYLVNQMYLGARAALQAPVEDQRLQAAQAAVAQLTCVKDYADAADLLAKAVANVTAVEAYQAKEAACMASVPCKAKRIAAQICSAIRSRREIEKDIHTEWRYGAEAGVVSVKRLGDDKTALEMIDDEVAEAKEAYRELTRQAFPAGSCR
jgi:hypothetical protein